jgi:hypothetical protein
VGAKPGGTPVKGALKPDQRADNEGACHSTDDYEIIVAHGLTSFG